MVTDEFGVRYNLGKEAPLNKARLRLETLGYLWIVLPRKALVGLTTLEECGTIAVRPKTKKGKVVAPEWVPETVANLEPEQQWVCIEERLKDCLEELERNWNGDK